MSPRLASAFLLFFAAATGLHAQAQLPRPQTGIPYSGAAPNYLAPGVKPDLAFGAFQRGLFVTAFRESMKRIDANPNDGPAMTIIGELYRDGLGVRTDTVEAARWYKLAADRGDPQGAFALALAYLQARGVKEDRVAARALLEKAAARKHVGAIYNLGLMAAEQNPPDYKLAATYFLQANDLGSADGAYALGVLYKAGNGVEKSPAKAVQWFKKAAAEHIVAAQLDLAIALFNGEGVEKDESLAASYFRRAAEANNPIAANRLARMLAAGRGVQKDIVEAMKWHILARGVGIDDEWLDSQLSTLTEQERNALQEAVRKQVGR